MARKLALAQWSRATSVRARPIPFRRYLGETAILLNQAMLSGGSLKSGSRLIVTATVPTISSDEPFRGDWFSVVKDQLKIQILPWSKSKLSSTYRYGRTAIR